MGLDSFKFAADLRDLITGIAEKTIDKNRPDVRIGYVYRFDATLQAAQILFRGETPDSLVRVHAATNMIPTRMYEDVAEEADIVRVAGKPGAYYITDYVRGTPQPTGAVPDVDTNFGGNRGVNLADPEDPQDAATKAYVDSLVEASEGAYVEFYFSTPTTTWELPHNLGKRIVNVKLVDMSYYEFVADVTYPDSNNALVTLGVPTAGRAIVTL